MNTCCCGLLPERAASAHGQNPAKTAWTTIRDMGHADSVWERPLGELTDHLERIADSLGIFTDGFSGHTSHPSEDNSPTPFHAETNFEEV
jgi:hypothetical protein